MLIDVIVQGRTPLMVDAFGVHLLDTGPKPTNNGQELPPKEQAELKLYTDDKGVPVWPVDNLLKSIIDAGRFVKIGRRQLSTRDETTVTAGLNITEQFLPIQTEHGWRVDTRGIVNQATKGRHICHRPIFDDWKLSFTLDVDTAEMSLVTARELIDIAGRKIGIGVMRPSRKGRYGQFRVIRWNERKVDLEKEGRRTDKHAAEARVPA